MDIDFNIKIQIEHDIDNIEHLLSLKPFENISDTYVQRAIFTSIMISLNNLTCKLTNMKIPITFTDDIIIDEKMKVTDISSLIKYIRDALCHIDSFKHVYNNNIILSYTIIQGKIPNAISINGTSIGSDYDDDICVIFGSQKIYYKRHIIRAFEECKKILLPLVED